MKPAIDTNLPPKAQDCMQKSVSLMAMGVSIALGQAFSEDVAAGKTVTVYAPLVGLPAAANDKRPPGERRLDLRFVLKPAAAP